MLPCWSRKIYTGRIERNVVNHDVTINSTDVSSYRPSTASWKKEICFDNKVDQTTKRKVQATFLVPRNIKKKGYSANRSNGRFVRKNIVPVSEQLGTAPSIPLHTRGLRRLLRQWMVGDKERGPTVPLSNFTVEQRNGKDLGGKQNKTIYSKRKTVAVATLLALQDATDNNLSFDWTKPDGTTEDVSGYNV